MSVCGSELFSASLQSLGTLLKLLTVPYHAAAEVSSAYQTVLDNLKWVDVSAFLLMHHQ